MSQISTSPDGKQNGLATASSAYLRSAIHQPVRWEEWGEEAFARAKAEDKPVLLDIGAVWCHWCHVMDRESYENERTAELINEHFVAVKVDRDERPDVDTRYQAAVAAISGQGGWPLTAFLTPDGKPFFGGTYFPPDDRHGRPSFGRVLLTMAEAFRDRRDEVDESAASVMQAIEHNETFSGHGGNLGSELVSKMVASALKQFDSRSGGFGSQPKFPHSSALDLLIDVASRARVGGNVEIAEGARHAARFTLEQMAQGGIYDHLAGGFHRYSVDDRWIVPHFEKMAYDNSELLKNYVHAFQTFAEPGFAETAKEIIGWMNAWLSDQEQGGFYASQDADFSLDDDGDYFTWTRDEAAAVLTREEMRFAGVYFDIGEVGDMHHNPAKNVLHITGTLEAATRVAGIEPADAAKVLQTVKGKLYSARLERPTPYVDKTMYTAWNAMCISAYLEAGRTLEMPEVVQFGLKSLARVLEAAVASDGGVSHVVAYGERGGDHVKVAGVLDDYAFLGQAALDAWETTGAGQFFRVAESIAEQILTRFEDKVGGGFFDTETLAEGERRLGALSARRKPLQDSPTPAGNPVAASLLLRLEALNGREDYVIAAQTTLETFAGVVEHFGLYAATYGLALQRIAQRPVQICILGEDAEARRMETVAMARFAVNKSVVRLRHAQLAALPPSLAETLPKLPGIEEGRSVAVVCSGNTCQAPVVMAEALRGMLNGVM
jgi:uncharacterized protein YyaL (SSP411 family)